MREIFIVFTILFVAVSLGCATFWKPACKCVRQDGSCCGMPYVPPLGAYAQDGGAVQ